MIPHNHYNDLVLQKGDIFHIIFYQIIIRMCHIMTAVYLIMIPNDLIYLYNVLLDHVHYPTLSCL